MLDMTLGEICLPETVPAKFTNVETYEEFKIDVEYILDKEFNPDSPGKYDVYATISIPDGYTNILKTSKLRFFFWITVTAPEADWHIEHNPLMNPFYVEAGSSPGDWGLQGSVYCYLKDYNLSHQDQVLGMLPIEWDLASAVYEPDKNGEFEATVRG